jgi:alpha-tubulin suppressor-like RCC1 family protein
LSNVVAIAAGGLQSVALQANGTLVVWGLSTLTNIPPGLVAGKVISAGFEHNLVLQSDLLTPVITEEPVDQYAPSNSSATFTVKAESLAQLTYQWQFNGTNLIGATNPALTLTDTQASNNGNYQVIVSTDAASISSSVATFTLVVPPEISASFTAPTNIWISSYLPLNVGVEAAGQSKYPLGYQWTLNGTNVSTAPGSYEVYPTAAADGNYTLVVTNIAGSNSISWNIRVALPGMLEAWGDDAYGECDRPATLTNVMGIAAGEYQSIAVTDTGSVVQWGQYWDYFDFYSVTNTNYVSLPPTSNVVAVAAGLTQALALLTDGTVRAWGLDGAYGTEVPSGLSNVTAIACGWEFNVALLANGTVISWGDDYFGQTNVPAGLSNVVAIAAGAQHTLALNSTPKVYTRN